MVNIKIEGVSYQVEAGLTILEAAKKCGYEIPSLCAFNHGECSQGSCRVCLVEVGCKRSGGLLRVSRERGHGDHHFQPQGSGSPPGFRGAAAEQS